MPSHTSAQPSPTPPLPHALAALSPLALASTLLSFLPPRLFTATPAQLAAALLSLALPACVAVDPSTLELEPALELRVADTYRSLGLHSRARQVARAVYDRSTADAPVRYEAAQALSVLVTELDEEEDLAFCFVQLGEEAVEHRRPHRLVTGYKPCGRHSSTATIKPMLENRATLGARKPA